MRILFTIIFLWFCSANAQTTYYVSNSGSDAANGTSTTTAWQTVAKVNSVTFVPGDQVLFNSGNSWNEKLIIQVSGTSSNPIKYGAYGTGAKPAITGFQAINTFSNIGGNIWRATVPQCSKTLNTVLIDGIIRAKGRYPNVGYVPTSSNGTTTQINTALSGDYTGYFIANRPVRWIIDVAKITSQTGGALTVSPALSSNSSNGYFLQNHVNVLDTLGEWAFDSTNAYLYVYSPATPNVKASTIDTLVYLSNKNYITFDGIEFNGGNMYALHANVGKGITVSNCLINNIGGRGFLGYYTNGFTFLSDTITNALSNGIFMDADTSTTITNCFLKNIAVFEGMGRNGNGNYIGTYSQGPNHHANLNRLDSCGYMGIRFQGTNNKIDTNYVTNYGFIKDDGGGIYTYQDYYTNSQGSRIRGNIVVKGIGAPMSSSDQYPQSYGIYLDLGSTGITVENNTVDSTTNGGIFSTGNHNTYINNTVRGGMINNPLYNTDYQFATIKGNIIYKTQTYYQTYVAYITHFDSTTIMDSNYYLIPSGNLILSANTSPGTYSLSAWQTASGKDAHSTATFPGNSTIGTLLYNPTLSSKTFGLTGLYTDVLGNKYYGSIIIPPFQSRLLFTTNGSQKFKNIRFTNFIKR